MSQTISKERIRQLEHAAILIYEHIKLADQKALVFIGLNGGLIGGLYGINILNSPHVTRQFSLLSFILLAVGMALAICTIIPRKGAKGEGVFAPWRISSFKSADEYHKRVYELTDEQFTKEFTDRVFDLSKIDRNKYQFLWWAVMLSVVAWVFSLLLAVTHAGAI